MVEARRMYAASLCFKGRSAGIRRRRRNERARILLRHVGGDGASAHLFTPTLLRRFPTLSYILPECGVLALLWGGWLATNNDFRRPVRKLTHPLPRAPMRDDDSSLRHACEVDFGVISTATYAGCRPHAGSAGHIVEPTAGVYLNTLK